MSSIFVRKGERLSIKWYKIQCFRMHGQSRRMQRRHFSSYKYLYIFIDINIYYRHMPTRI